MGFCITKPTTILQQVKISYQLTIDDHKAFVLHYGKKTKNGNNMYWLSRLFLTGILFLFGVKEFMQDDVRPAMVVVWGSLSLFAYLMFPVLYDLVLEQGAKRVAQKADADEMMRHQTLDITEEGIGVSSGDMQGFSPWEDVLSWDKTDEHVFIFLADNAAHIIPATALGDEDDVDAFVSYLETTKAAAKGE